MSGLLDRYPPPWHWEYHPDNGKPIALTSPSGDVLLASGDERFSYLIASEEVLQAMAALPELINAMKEIRHFCIPGMNWTDEIGQELLRLADAAIIKATGGEPTS